MTTPPPFDPTQFDDSAHGNNALKNFRPSKQGELDDRKPGKFDVTLSDAFEAPKIPLDETPEERWAR